MKLFRAARYTLRKNNYNICHKLQNKSALLARLLVGLLATLNIMELNSGAINFRLVPRKSRPVNRQIELLWALGGPIAQSGKRFGGYPSGGQVRPKAEIERDRWLNLGWIKRWADGRRGLAIQRASERRINDWRIRFESLRLDSCFSVIATSIGSL